MASAAHALMSLIRMVMVACFFFVVCVQAHPQHGFCTRTHGTAKGCPTPPTFDAINLTAFAGSWFQIGISARSQFRDQPGSVCARAKYELRGHSPSHQTLFSVLNSALSILRPAGVADIYYAGTTSFGVCNSARSSCHVIGHINDHALELLKDHPALLKNVTDAAKIGEAALDSAAGRIGHIQGYLNQLSQANYTVSLANTTEKMEVNAEKLKAEDAGALRLAGKLLEDAGRKVEAMQSMKAVGKKIRLAGKELVKSAKNIEKGAIQLRKTARSLAKGNGRSITVAQGAKAYKVEGEGVQIKGGKLQVKVKGEVIMKPYWVLAVDSHNEAALVYSCVNDSDGNIAEKSIFIIARSWKPDPSVVEGFLSLAQSYGISSDCEDSFSMTVQRGGSCGLPPHSM